MINTRLLFLIFLFAFLGCKKSLPENERIIRGVNPEFAAYISAYTSGLISTESSIKVILQSDYPLGINDDKSLKDQLLKFSPSIEGTAYLLDESIIEFIPKTKLKQGEIYTGKLELDKIHKNIPNDLKIFEFQFQVKKQSYQVSLDGLQDTEKGQGNYQFIGVLSTADVVSSGDFTKVLSAKLNGENLPVSWTSSEDRRNHRFVISGIQAKNNAEKLELNWNGNSIGADQKETQTFIIPAKDDFTVTQVKSVSYPEQYISVNFSQALQSDAYIDGLVDIQKTSNNESDGDYYDDDEPESYIKSMIINGNELKIYTSKKIGGEYELKLFSGIKSVYGNVIETVITEKVNLNNLHPEVRFVGNGNIVPSVNGKVNVPFEAVGLNAVRLEITKIFENNIHQFFQYNQFNTDQNLRLVGRKVYSKVIAISNADNFNIQEMNVYQLELSDFIKPEPGAIYNLEFSFDRSFASFPCGENELPNENLTQIEIGENDYETDSELYSYNYEYDYYDYDYYYPEGYNWSDRNDPCTVSYYTSDRNVSKNILASNLGIIYKSGKDKTAYVTVTDLVTAQPLENTKIKAFDLQNQLAGEGMTNKDGFATFPLKRKPFLIIAERENQRGYVRVDNGSSLSLSNFDVEGESPSTGLGGFIYGERGVWRPGDKIYLTFVMDQTITQISDEQPAILELKSPDGQLFQRKVNSNPINGFYVFELETPVDAKTGNWNAQVKIGGKTFNKSIKIETIKPNRLKVNTIFPQDILTRSSGQGFEIQAQWLSGATAQNLKAKVDATLFASKTEFKSFPKYIFTDPSRSFFLQEMTIFDGDLNSEGKAHIDTNFNIDNSPPGMLTLGIFTKVFERGGDFSTSYITKEFSPYSSYVGIQVPTSDNDYWEMLETNKEHTIQVASVDYNGNPISQSDLQVSIYRMKNSWWYNSNENDLAYYVNREYEYLQEEKKISTTNGRGSFKVKIPNDEYGNYFIRVVDLNSGHSTGKRIWFDWPDWRSRGDNNSESAVILQFKSDKPTYKVGETAQITIPSSVEGRAMISFENGTRVIDRKWIETKAGETKFDVKITPEMTPNIYVNISLIQPHGATKNDLPIRMYGLISLKVDDQNRKIEPIVKAPASVKPNSEYTVSVSEKTGKPMTYTLAVVDEGLLDITNFKTPDIYSYFNQKQALGVNTWDIYNYVLGAYGGRIESVFTIGGDLALQNSNKEKINRFKPVVKFLGPFSLEKGKTQSHKIKMDNYVGSVKIMVVAGSGSAFGSAEKNMFVKQPLMTLTSLPRVLNPGDEISLPVNVFAMEKSVKNVSVSIKTNSYLEIIGNKTNSLQFSNTGDQIANFKLKVPHKIGKAKLFISAISGKEKHLDTIQIEVRSPNPPMTLINSKEILTQKSWTETYEPFGMNGTTDTKLILSSVPAMNLERRVQFLIKYPHGCIEQSVSSVFPQLYLGDLMNLTEKQQKEIQYNIEQLLIKLKSFQVPGGGLAYWPGNGRPDPWGTNYAFDFILKAERKGYKLPAGLKEGIIKYQIKTAKEWSGYNEKYYYNDLDQAYRLYTLAVAGKAELGLMNRLKEKKTDLATIWRLAAAYQIAGQENTAKKMVSNLATSVKDYRFNRYTYGSSERDDAMILETLSLLDERTKGLTLMKKIAANLNSSRWYSTQTTAYSLMAISEFLGSSSNISQIQAEVIINGKSQKVSAKKPFINVDLPESKGSFTVKNSSGSLLFVDLVRSGVSVSENLKQVNQNLDMRVSYFDMNNNPISPDNLAQGTDFQCVVNVTNPGMMGNYNVLALTQMFPSGWEIINTRVNNQMTSVQNIGITYQDFRDDRVYSYFDLNAGRQISVTILLNATYKGNFYLPATYCEAMYDNTISSIVPGKRVIVQ